MDVEGFKEIGAVAGLILINVLLIKLIWNDMKHQTKLLTEIKDILLMGFRNKNRD